MQYQTFMLRLVQSEERKHLIILLVLLKGKRIASNLRKLINFCST